jgi:3-hydroxybutyryl-CoA dehydrogenase
LRELVAIIGAGTMGRGIAQVAAQAGYPVMLQDVSAAALTKAREELEGDLARLEAKNKLNESAGAMLGRIEATTELEELHRAHWVVEAAPEDLALKRGLFSQLGEMSETAVLATNTSTLPVTAIAGGVRRPERVVGLHFFNPAPLMRLVEVVPGIETSKEVLDKAVAFAKSLGKTPAVAKDSPGFIVNRVARPFYGEALKLYGEGIPLEAIDGIMRGLGFRMGPFELMDLIGLDVNLAATESVYRAFFEEPRYRPSPIQQMMVTAGYLGKKSGRGFYRYPREEREAAEKASEDRPKAFIVGENALARALRETFAHADEGDAELILDARVAATEKAYLDASVGLPIVTCVWGHSASLSCKYYRHRRGEPVAGFSLIPPLPPHPPAFGTPLSKGGWGGVAEIYPPLSGENEAVEAARRYFTAHGLGTLTLSDQPGGVGFRILAMLINEAVSALAEGVAGADDLDSAMKLGTNYPLGPLEWSRVLGLESVLLGLEGLMNELGEDRYRPHPLLRRMVATGVTHWRK